MSKEVVRRLIWVAVCVVAIAAMTVVVAQGRQQAAAQPGSSFDLVRPLFLETASAEDAAITAFIDSEAGIAAYFQAPGGLSLATARPLFRTIEAQTDTYILGSIAVPGYVSESEDVHVYLHTDGWVLAYYLAATPAANTIDWARFNGTTIVTKFDTVFQILAAQLAFTLPTATYYDFRNPSANYLLLVAEEANPSDSFTVFLNESLSYFERSWSFSSRGHAGYYKLDNVIIEDSDFPHYPNWGDLEGVFTPLQLTVNANHTISLERKSCCLPPLYGGLALVYRRP